MTTFAAVASTLEARAPDATKHVNYSLGMVLGVDDFNQEFAWLSGRDRWLARDAIGYGTLCGLRVTSEAGGSKGPRLRVASGNALTPRGQLVCVKPDQCAYLNDWLTAHKDEVFTLAGSPSSGSISLYLTLCYRDCPVDLVPIPGAPCRSEDELMAHSRLADDFQLELRTKAPDQSEEDVLRQFVAWLRSLPMSASGAVTPEQFEQAMRDAITVASPSLSSPPSSPPSPLSSPPSGGKVVLVFASPLASIVLDPALASEYLRAAFRVWVESIRPHVHAICSCSGGCCGSKDSDPPKTDECLLLARVDVPVIFSSGNWLVDETGTIEIDESQRPILVHLRMLQELLVTAPAAASVTATGAPRVVAAGLVGITASASPIFGGLTVALHAQNTIRLNFTGYSNANRYVVKAMSNTGIANPTITYVDTAPAGILLQVRNGVANIADATLNAAQFMIEISQIG